MRKREGAGPMLTRMKLLALAAVVVALGFTAGCGGSGGDGDDESTTAGTNFSDCMKQQGIDVPTARPSGFPTARPSGLAGGRPSGFPTVRPSGGFPSGAPGGGSQGGFPGGLQRPNGVDEQQWRKALEACGSLRASLAPGGQRPGGGDGPGGNDGMRAFLNCLSEHGVTYTPGQTLPEDAKVCEVLRPSPTAAP